MNSAVLAVKHHGTYTVPSRDFPSFRPQGFSLKGEILSRRISSRTFSVSLCPSLSVSVRLCLFPSVPRPSTLFLLTILFFSGVPFCRIRVHAILPFPSILSFQLSILGSDLTSVSFDLVSYCFHYCSAITPISPTPLHSDLLLFSASYCTMFRSDLIVPLCIIMTSCSSLAPA